MPTIVQPTIFREYIGAKLNLNEFPTIINPEVNEFHFILAFATETYDETTKAGTGTFTPSWKRSAFDAHAIRDLKAKYETEHTNVKVFISIGGRGPQYPFNPAAQDKWLDNAKKSLERILDDYTYKGTKLIDGIDVYYEKINSRDDVFAGSIGKFAWCIGELIKSLKEEKKLIKEASIAPSYSVQRQYKGLYQAYKNYINWVDYLFYSEPDDNVPTKEEFVNRYFTLLNDYPNKILLAGFSTDPSDKGEGKISKEDFLDGCLVLLTMKLLPGIFVWDAYNSQLQNPRFVVEERAQRMIVDFNQTSP